MTSSLACGILWRFGAIIPAPRSSVKNAMAGDAHAQLRTLVLLPTAWSACAVSGYGWIEIRIETDPMRHVWT
jgi:hypothetical protein